MKRSTPPPPGSVRCSVCKNFAWHDVGQHAVKSGGAWHHPSCPQLGQPRQTFRPEYTPRNPESPIRRVLILFRPLAFVLIASISSVVLALAVVAACAWISGCAELARDSYEHDLRQCAIDNKGKTDADYAACKSRVKVEWSVDGGANGSE